MVNLTVKTIYSNFYAFAALKDDGSLVTWGGKYQESLGQAKPIYDDQLAEQISGGVEKVYSNDLGFAVLKTDGSVVSWGDLYYAPDNGFGEKLTQLLRELYT